MHINTFELQGSETYHIMTHGNEKKRRKKEKGLSKTKHYKEVSTGMDHFATFSLPSSYFSQFAKIEAMRGELVRR